MTRVVETVAPEFEDVLTWEKIVTKDLAGARRFSELSKALGRLVPIPSIAIGGELLKACIHKFIKKLPNSPD